MIVVRSARGDYPIVEGVSLPPVGLDAIVTDANVAKRLGPFGESPTLVLPPGEGTKTMAHLEGVLRWFAGVGLDRRSVVGAVGGGVVGDLVGFAAATYMRGIAYVGVPTTLLAMVDSSVGGKVAVDLPEGKNLAGAFWPPREVRLDPGLLATLPPEEWRAGMAEVLKAGLILDADLAGELETPLLLPGDARTSDVIRRAIGIKRGIVEEDEDETQGRRALLNFGHTVGHAVEALTGYARYRHGEAVAIGMVAEARLGELAGITEPGTSATVARLCRTHGLPTEVPEDLERGALVAAMRRDKKARGGGLAFALLETVGRSRLVYDLSEPLVERALSPEGRATGEVKGGERAR